MQNIGPSMNPGPIPGPVGIGDFEIAFKGQISKFHAGATDEITDVTLTGYGTADLDKLLEVLLGRSNTTPVRTDVSRLWIFDDAGQLKLRIVTTAQATTTVYVRYLVFVARDVQRGQITFNVNNSRETSAPAINDVGDINKTLLVNNGCCPDAAFINYGPSMEIGFTSATALTAAASAGNIFTTYGQWALGKKV